MTNFKTILCFALLSFSPVPLGVAFAQERPNLPISDLDKTNTPSKSEIKKAVELYDEGQLHFHGKRFPEAAHVFEQSYALHQKPKTLFAWAQAERLAESCAVAKKLFERFLLTETSEANRSAVKKLIGLCKVEKTESPEGSNTQSRVDDGGGSDSTLDETSSLSDPLPNTRTEPTLVRKQSRSTPWYSDLLTDSLLVGGSVGAGVGIGFWLSSRTALRSAESETQSHSAALADYDRAKSKRTIALVSGSLGLGLFAGAIIRIITRSPAEESLRVGARLDSDRAALWVSGGF